MFLQANGSAYPAHHHLLPAWLFSPQAYNPPSPWETAPASSQAGWNWLLFSRLAGVLREILGIRYHIQLQPGLCPGCQLCQRA